MSASRVPPLLTPYVGLPPPSSLVLLTSVLGASTNWLVLRFMHTALTSASPSTSPSSEQEGEFAILLVSFLRDLTFWAENSRKVGLDLVKEAKAGRWRFLDFLTRERGVNEVREDVEAAARDMW